jgi:hypothetical protein
MNTISKKIIAVALPILSVFVIHYVATNLYAKICADLSLFGFLTSLMTTGSPVCNSLLTVMNTTNNSYSVLLTGLVSGAIVWMSS